MDGHEVGEEAAEIGRFYTDTWKAHDTQTDHCLCSTGNIND